MFEREMKKEKNLDQIRAKRGGGGGCMKKTEWPNYRDYDDDVLRQLEGGTLHGYGFRTPTFGLLDANIRRVFCDLALLSCHWFD
jgi:hypothetical protein